MEKKQQQKMKKGKISKSRKIIQQFIITDIIQQLKLKGSLQIQTLKLIIKEASHVLKNQPNMLYLPSPITVVGDIHGQFFDLLNIFNTFGQPQQTPYLFLGDYVDRGKFCIEVITLLMILKINLPNKIHLLRGNHEGRTMTTFFNFKTQCQKKYNKEIYQLFIDFFKTIPLCAIIDNKYFAVHGGISPQLKKLSDIQKINRFVQIPQSGALCDLLWSDPIDQSQNAWMSNKVRSCSYFYSRVQSHKFLKNNNMRLIIRGHEVQMRGFKYQYQNNSTDPLTLTIFSAPKYCDTYTNKGAVACINEKSIEIKPFRNVEHPFIFNNYLNSFQISFPIIAMNVNKIFNVILKSKKIKQSIKSDQLQMKTILDKISGQASLQQLLNVNHNNISQLLSLSNINLNITSQDSEIQTSDNFLQFHKTRAEDAINEKLPASISFGPKRIQFVRIRVQNQDDRSSQQQNKLQ